jgi:hypothetical protein
LENGLLPEDLSMRGLLWTENLFPESWFAEDTDDEGRYLEGARIDALRMGRCLWLGGQIAKRSMWLVVDPGRGPFSVAPPRKMHSMGEPQGQDTAET